VFWIAIFGFLLGKRQYLNIVRIRAIEFRRNIIKYSNKGFSAVIDEKGEIVQKIDKVFQNVEAKRINRPSFYCKLLNFAFKE
jgi:apolipoprotein N-acyltransferase